jgi:hypothetical protein
MSTSNSASSQTFQDFQNLYCQFYGLFGEASPALKALAMPEPAAPAAASTELSPEIKKIATEESELSVKFSKLFAHHAGLAADAVDSGTMISISRNAMVLQQIHDAFGSIAIASSAGWMASFVVNYKTIETQRKRLFLDGILSEESFSQSIFEEAVKKSLLPGIFTMLASIGTILVIIPDPSFATKITAMCIFIGMNLYAAAKQFQAAHETSKMIDILRSTPKALVEDIENPKKLSYQDFLQKIIDKNKTNRALIKIFLEIGEQLKQSQVDLNLTQLTHTEWLKLSKKTLQFKRWMHVVNGIRSFFGSIALALMMGTGALALLKVTQALGQALSAKLGVPAMMGSGLLTSTKLAQHFSVSGLFKIVLKKLSFGSAVKFSTPVLNSKNIKKLESKEMQSAIKKCLKEDSVDLSKTLSLIKNIRTDDFLFKTHPELKDLLKRAVTDKARITFLTQIGELIGSIPSITEAQEKSAKAALKKAHGLSKTDRSFAEEILKMLRQNSFTGHPTIQTQIKALQEKINDSSGIKPGIKSGIKSGINGWEIKNLLSDIYALSKAPISEKTRARSASSETSDSINSSQTIPTPGTSPSLSRESSSQALLHVDPSSGAAHGYGPGSPISREQEGVEEHKGTGDEVSTSPLAFSKAEIQLILKAIDLCQKDKGQKEKFKKILETYSRINLHLSTSIQESFEKIKDWITAPSGIYVYGHKISNELLKINSAINSEINSEINSDMISFTPLEVEKARKLLEKHPSESAIENQKALGVLKALKKINVHHNKEDTDVQKDLLKNLVEDQNLPALLSTLRTVLEEKSEDRETLEDQAAEIRKLLSLIYERCSPLLTSEEMPHTGMVFFKLPEASPLYHPAPNDSDSLDSDGSDSEKEPG